MSGIRSGRAWPRVALLEAWHGALVPVLLFGVVVAANAVLTLAVPGQLRGPVLLGATVGIFAAGYLVAPKSTLIVFPAFMLFSRLLAHWFDQRLLFVDELGLPALLVLAAWRTRPWHHRDLLSPVRDLCLLALLVAGIIASLAAGVPADIWTASLFKLAMLFAFFYVVVWHDVSASDIRRAAPLYLGLAALIVAVAAAQLVNREAVESLLNIGGRGASREGLPSIGSLLRHPVSLSTFTTVMGLFLFAGYALLGRRWMLLGALGLSITTLLTGRRKGLIGLAVGLVTGIAATLRPSADRPHALRRWLLVAGALALIAFAFLPSLLGLARMTADELVDPQTARVSLYRVSAQIAVDRFPLGVGLGRFGSHDSVDPYSPVYEQYGIDDVRGLTRDNPAFVKDAFWARILGETGVVGTAALIAFAAAVALQLARATGTRFADPLATAFVLGAAMVFAEALVETTVTSLFDFPPQVHLILGSAAAALALQRSGSRAARPE